MAYNVLNTDGVIVSTKWPCTPTPRFVWTEDALAFSILWTSEMVSYVKSLTMDFMEGKGKTSTIFLIVLVIVLKK